MSSGGALVVGALVVFRLQAATPAVQFLHLRVIQRHIRQSKSSGTHASAEECLMQSHTIPGAGGARLHVVETGNAQGRPILYSHGLSDKPQQGYEDTKLWADDVNAVVETLRLDQPVLCGWSYGPLLILDYVRHYGTGKIGGIHFVATVTKLVTEDAGAVLGPEFLVLIPGFFSADAKESA